MSATATATAAVTIADEWFADYLEKVKRSYWRRERLHRDAIEHPGDYELRAERAYDAETDALLEQIHAAQEVTR